MHLSELQKKSGMSLHIKKAESVLTEEHLYFSWNLKHLKGKVKHSSNTNKFLLNKAVLIGHE